MQLFQMWRDSLKVFIPHNFKLFSLVSINAAVKTYVIWLGFFWPLFIVSLLSDALFIFPFSIGPVQLSVSALVSIASKFLLFITLFLSLRPSIKRKTYAYFSDYLPHITVLVILFFTKNFLLHAFFGIEARSADLFATSLFAPFFSIPMTVFMLFYLDTRGSFKDLFMSGFRSLKMLWFSLPFYFILACAASIAYSILLFTIGMTFFPFMAFFRMLPIGFSGLLLWSFAKHIFILFAVIPIAFASSFYTKNLHDQSKRYFG